MVGSVVSRVIVIAFILAITASRSIDAKTADKNDMWRPNEDIFKLMDPLYYELALQTNDTSNHRKRFVSIVSLSVAIYMNSNVTDEEQRVQETVSKTRKELNKPADWIAGIMRAILTVLRAIIDKPINDVKISCPPEAEQASCRERLHELHDRNEAACHGYMRNVQHHGRILNLIHGKDFTDVSNDVARNRNHSDEDALNYFIKLAEGKHSAFLKEMRDIYQAQLRERFDCNVLNVPI